MMPEDWDLEADSDASEDSIAFFPEDVDFEVEPEKESIWINWLEPIIAQEKGELSFLNIIFCTDAYLLELNMDYLQHDTLTDIITFPYASPPKVEGDIFISIERIRENAEQLNIPFERELTRVIIHGVLHLCGYGDKTPEDKNKMTAKEDEALALLG
jgi:rRNA maturation RNase YbeY